MSIRSIRLAVIFILVLFSASLVSVPLVGKHSRRYAPGGLNAGSAFLVKKTSGVYSLWKETGFFGNVLIHCSAHFSFVPVRNIPGTAYPLEQGAVSSRMTAYENELSYKNYLWVAMQAGLVRHIYNVLPVAVYDKKARAVAGNEHPPFDEKSTSGRKEIADSRLGLPRTISVNLPQTKEPVLMNIDASYLSGVDIREFAHLLEKSGLRIGLLTLCLSEDSPDVAEGDREKLKRLADILLTGRFIESLTPVDYPYD